MRREQDNRFISTVDEIAAAFGLKKRRIQQLAEDGVIPKLDKGKYDLIACTQSYIKHLTNLAANSTEGRKGQDSKSRWLDAKATKAELELKVLEKKYIDVDELEFEWSNLVLAFRAKMLSMPSKLAMILAGTSEPAKAHKILEDEIYDALTELSKYGSDGISDEISDPEQSDDINYELNSGKESSSKDSSAITATS